MENKGLRAEIQKSRNPENGEITLASEGWVYVIEAWKQGLFKVGMTSGEPEDRLKQLQTGCPYKLDLVIAFTCNDMAEMEKRTLAAFFKGGSVRMVGEWFALKREDVLDGMMHLLAGIMYGLGIAHFRSGSIRAAMENPERFQA